MHGDYFDDFMPWSVNSDRLNLKDRRDMVNLGRENLLFLAKFWEQHAKKMYAKVDNPATTYQNRERFEHDARDSTFKAREIKKIAETAESKPRLFEKPAFKTGSQVTCFLEKPDRFVSGVLAKVKADATINEDGTAEIKDAILSIRVYDHSGQHLIDYVPDGFTLFMTEDFEYFRRHWQFFELYLNYHTWTIPERDKVNRMLYCLLSSLPDPPTAA